MQTQTQKTTNFDFIFSETVYENSKSIRGNGLDKKTEEKILDIFYLNYRISSRFICLYQELEYAIKSKNPMGIWVLYFAPEKNLLIGFFYMEFGRDESGIINLRFLNVHPGFQNLGIGMRILETFKYMASTHILCGRALVSSPISRHYVETVGANIIGASNMYGGMIFDLECDPKLNKRLVSRSWNENEIRGLLQRQESANNRGLDLGGILKEFEPIVVVRKYTDTESLFRETKLLTQKGYQGTRILSQDEEKIIVFETRKFH